MEGWAGAHGHRSAESGIPPRPAENGECTGNPGSSWYRSGPPSPPCLGSPGGGAVLRYGSRVRCNATQLSGREILFGRWVSPPHCDEYVGGKGGGSASEFQSCLVSSDAS